VIVSVLILGTILLVAVFISQQRPLASSVSGTRVAGYALACIACQTAHFAEEWSTGFVVRFPALFGLAPLSDTYFLGVNLTFIAVWVIAAAALWRDRPLGMFSLWFLGLASVLNLVFHPAISLAVGGYFPGLYTCFPVGIAGIVLIQKLLAFTTEA
jgi:hypothetical protein